MALRVGCDIVCISRFRQRLAEGGTGFREKIFLPGELLNPSADHLAGIFAAKEAVCKALSLPSGRWLEIVIEYGSSGAPEVLLAGSHPQPKDLCISISHDGDYALAFAVVLT